MDIDDISGKVMQFLDEAGFSVPASPSGVHLFYDIAMDSLSFIRLLMRIEDSFGIVFDIVQMEECTQLDRLLALIDHKLREGGR